MFARTFCSLVAITIFAIATLVVGWLPALAVDIPVGEHVFTLPDGYEIEQIAGPDLVERPITIDFDEQGNMYAADSSGSNEPTAKQAENPTHRIVKLIDRDGDGRFDERTIFADKMMFPEGTMWLDGSLYVAAPPTIWKLTDTDGDGVADKREEWFKGKTLTGCANDLHGPYRGPDGWIYWCKGAFAEQTYDRPGRKPLVSRASHIFRCRPDGSKIEAVMTGGMDNPVDCVFTPDGERIFNTTFLVNPAGGMRDGIIHAIYGGVYGKDHDVLDGHPRTGDLMPVLDHLGPAAPAGLTIAESNGLGDDVRGDIFCCQFNRHKVSRHKLERDGASFKTIDSDFVVSSHIDFHPTDVVEDADGSLIVVDTGGWYKLCCPTSQFAKPDVLGGIYRVRKIGAEKVEDPRGTKIDFAKLHFDDLIELFDDARVVVRTRAQRELSAKGKDFVDSLRRAMHRRDASVSKRLGIVWTLNSMDSPEARLVVRTMVLDPDPTVAAAALHGISLWRDAPAKEHLLHTLKHWQPHVQRLAVECLGRIGEADAVPALLELADKTGNDRALEHAVIYALIEIGAVKETEKGLTSESSRIRKAALIALDQMDEAGGPDANLSPAVVAEALGSHDAALRQAAVDIMQRHSDWGPQLSDWLAQHAPDAKTADEQIETWAGLLGTLSDAESVQKIAADALGSESTSPKVKLAVAKAMRRFSGKQLPSTWLVAFESLLTSASATPELTAAVVDTARSLKASKTNPAIVTALLAFADRDGSTPSQQLAALAAAAEAHPVIADSVFNKLTAVLQPSQPVAERMLATECLTQANLSLDQRLKLIGVLKQVGPLEFDRLLSVFEGQTDRGLGTELVAALGDAEAFSSLRGERLKNVLSKFDGDVMTAAEPLMARLDAEVKEQRARLETLFAEMPKGDVRRGHAVFQSTKASCIACHAMGYLGANVGPDLTKIGQIRTDKDLLESILFPSASFVRSYEPVTVALTDGRSVSGLIRRDNGRELVVATGPNKEERIPRDEVEEITPSTVSIMPAGLEKQLSMQELADLIAFLKAAK
jgi:putative membrane-bound dehydrogenase-like protein